MTTFTSTPDDRLIWSLSPGQQLLCKKDLVMSDGEVSCREGVIYEVESMNPIYDPAIVRILDDQKESHSLDAKCVREYFHIQGLKK